MISDPCIPPRPQSTKPLDLEAVKAIQKLLNEAEMLLEFGQKLKETKVPMSMFLDGKSFNLSWYDQERLVSQRLREVTRKLNKYQIYLVKDE